MIKLLVLLFIYQYLPMEKQLEAITQAYGIPTLETQHSDSEDFHDIPVWTIKAMLEEAYKKGKKDAKK
ncbi:MAG: hypothetical protein Q4B28_06750 [bacterium]|nr:hypothetical protein [bacterium]